MFKMAVLIQLFELKTVQAMFVKMAERSIQKVVQAFQKCTVIEV